MDTQDIMSNPPPKARKTAAMIYLSSFVGVLIPFGNVIAPLIIWLLKRDEDPFINEQGKEVVNFNLSLLIIVLGAIILNFVLVMTIILSLLSFLVFIALFAIGLYALVIIIIGTIKVTEGVHYRIPYLNFRLIK